MLIAAAKCVVCKILILNHALEYALRWTSNAAARAAHAVRLELID